MTSLVCLLLTTATLLLLAQTEEAEAGKFLQLVRTRREQSKGGVLIYCPDTLDDPGSWSLLTSHARCYKHFPDKVTYEEAAERCRNESGVLAIPTDKQAHDKLLDIADPADKSGWLGLNDLVTEGEFVWEDGTKFNRLPWSGFSPYEPNDFLSREDCVLLRDSGIWVDNRCGLLNQFYCQVDAVIEGEQLAAPECPTGWTLMGVKCYKVNTDVLWYDDAKAACVTDGGILVQPQTEYIYQWLLDWEELSNTTSYPQFHFGLRKVNGNYVWDDDRQITLTETGWDKWANGQPTDSNDCVTVGVFTKKWKTTRCNRKLPSVCQTEPEGLACAGPGTVVDGPNLCSYILCDAKHIGHRVQCPRDQRWDADTNKCVRKRQLEYCFRCPSPSSFWPVIGDKCKFWQCNRWFVPVRRRCPLGRKWGGETAACKPLARGETCR